VPQAFAAEGPRVPVVPRGSLETRQARSRAGGAPVLWAAAETSGGEPRNLPIAHSNHGEERGAADGPGVAFPFHR
jgi:hypothetical protein